MASLERDPKTPEPLNARGRSRAYWLLGAKWLLALVAIGYLVVSERGSLSQLAQSSAGGELWLRAGLGAIVLLAALCLAAFRWFLLLSAQGSEISLAACLRIGLITSFSSLVLPSAVGGDAVRAVLVSRSTREQDGQVAAIWSIVVDRVIGLLGLLALVVLTSVVAWPSIAGTIELRAVALGSTAAFALLVATLGLGLSRRLSDSKLVTALHDLPRVGSSFRQISQAMLSYRRRSAVLLAGVALSVVVHGSYVGVLRILGLGVLGDPVPVEVVWQVVPLALAAGALPLTPGGVGVTEVAIDEMLGVAGYPDADVLPVMLQFRAIQVVLAIACALGLVLWRRGVASKDDQPPEASPR